MLLIQHNVTNLQSGKGDAIVAGLLEGNAEAVAALAYLAEAFEADPQAAFAKTASDWRQWLEDEGYTPDSVNAVIRQVVASELDAAQQQALSNNVAAGMTLGELAKGIHAQSPTLLNALLRHVDHGAALHTAVLGAAGGTGKNPISMTSNPKSILNQTSSHLRNEILDLREIRHRVDTIAGSPGDFVVDELKRPGRRGQGTESELALDVKGSTEDKLIKVINTLEDDRFSFALESIGYIKDRLTTLDPEKRQAEMAKVSFIESTIEEVRQERQQRIAIVQNIETAITTDPEGVAAVVMSNRDEIPFEIENLRDGQFIRKERKEKRNQLIEDEFTTEENVLWIKRRRERREQEVRALEDAIRKHPEEAAKALIVERKESRSEDDYYQQLLDREEDRLAEQVVDLFIDDIREERRAKREREQSILFDLAKSITTDPEGVAAVVMSNRDEIPFEIEKLRDGQFIRKERKEKLQLIDDEISTERNNIWKEKRRESREQGVRALEDAIRKHPEEAAKALVVELNNKRAEDDPDQKPLDLEGDLRSAEIAIKRFIDGLPSQIIKSLSDDLFKGPS